MPGVYLVSRRRLIQVAHEEILRLTNGLPVGNLGKSSVREVEPSVG